MSNSKAADSLPNHGNAVPKVDLKIVVVPIWACALPYNAAVGFPMEAVLHTGSYYMG